jgi:predicted transcriptional regulator
MIPVSPKHQDKDVIGRLQKLAEAKDRSVNYLAVQAIEAYLEQYEAA